MAHTVPVPEQNQYDTDPARARRLGIAGITFHDQFTRTGMLSNLEKAIRHQQQAVLLAPDDHPDKPALLNNLGVFFNSRFRRMGMLSDLGEAIKYAQRAALLTPDGHPDKPMQLSNLGVFFDSRVRCIRMLGDLEDAIRNQEQAVLLTPDNHLDKMACLHSTNIGIYFENRFRYTGILNDLGEAINHIQRAALLTPAGDAEDADRLGQLNCLVVSFQSMFRQTGMLGDVKEAIKNQQQVLLPALHNLNDKLVLLSNPFENPIRCAGMLSNPEEAVEEQHQAMLPTPDVHPDQTLMPHTPGIPFENRFNTDMLSDLDETVENQRRAVSLTPDGHASKPVLLSNLGISFMNRFRCSGMPNDLDEAIIHLQLAATSNINSHLLRFLASRLWGRLAAERDPPSALVAYRRAIELVPQVAWTGNPIITRHSQLDYLADIPREAAALALDAGHPDLALEWLEHGRSVIRTQHLNIRTPIHDLRQEHPDICAEFTQISRELQSATTRGYIMNLSDSARISLEEETQCHHRLAEKWDLLVARIRSLPDFGDFLLPKKVCVLKQAASYGPVVVINVHRRRCDALVLERGRDQVLHFALDKLRYKEVENFGKLTKRGLGAGVFRAARSARSCINRIPLWIHSTFVWPILTGLGLTAGISDPLNLPRIWWCPTGPLALVPLHAAHRGFEYMADATFDYVVSSYTPTIGALLEARTAKPQPFKQLVGVAMTNAPNHPPLPGVEIEVEKIGKLSSAGSGWTFEALRGEQVTGERVLTHMAEGSWIHFACHATRDEQEITQSSFHLHDRRLTIADIISCPFNNADFAFLSSCDNMVAGDREALNEAVVMPDAMLVAGYRSVIGTMWPIPDEVAPIVAEKVYENLLSGGEPNSERAARALHEAMKELRKLTSSHDRYPLGCWVPYVHYGV